MEVLGYKYINEQDAIDDCQQCSDYYGIPIHHDDVSQQWTTYLTAELNTPIFWYIPFHESLPIVLGDPETFEVKTQIEL